MSDMTLGIDADLPVEPCRRPRAAVATGVTGVLALVVVALLTLLDRVQVQTQHELAHVAFGMPLSWVTQVQGLDPPLPYSADFSSPWENPTVIDLLPLVANVLIVGLVLTAVRGVVLAVRSKPSPE